MAKLYNLAGMSTTTTGTGTITLGSAMYGHLTFAQAGVADGDTVTYAIKDGANSEIGRGVYTSSGTTLTRTVLKSTNSNSAISLSGSAEVFITPAAEDIIEPPSSSVDSEIVLYSGTTGDVIKRASTTGLLKATSGVLDAAGAADIAALGLTFGGLRNRIRNPNFAINQRAVSGTVTLASGEYGHDGWKGGSAGGTYTFSTSAGITTLTISAGTLVQVVEGGFSIDQSGTYTLSWTGTAQARIDGGSYGASGITATLTGGTNATIEFGTGTVSKVQLEQGASPTSFSTSPPLDWEFCRRYFQRYGGLSGLGNYQTIMMGFFWNASQAVFVHRLPVRMRATPTLSYATADSIACGNNSVSAAVSSMALSGGVNNTPEAVEFIATLASAVGTGGAGCRLSGNNSASAYFDLIAEL